MGRYAFECAVGLEPQGGTSKSKDAPTIICEHFREFQLLKMHKSRLHRHHRDFLAFEVDVGCYLVDMLTFAYIFSFQKEEEIMYIL